MNESLRLKEQNQTARIKLMIVKELLKEGNKILRNNHIKTSMLDEIISMVINKTRENVLLSEDIKLSKRQINHFNHLIRRRAKRTNRLYCKS